MSKTIAVRIPIILCVILALLGALWAALMRVGWQLPPLPVPLAGQHGALMISGFLGTLVSLERAVALQRKWAYAAPLLAGIGGVTLLIGLPPEIGRGLITLGSIGLVLIFAFIYRLHPTIDVITMTLGSVMWLTGNLLWLVGPSIVYAVPWWAGFLILTIAGERIELSRVLMLKPISRTIFKIAVVVFSIGLALSLVAFDGGLKLSGLGLIMLGAWYRLAMVSFALMWTILYLMQKSNYNNHYYLILLLCWLMAILPANRAVSVDAWRNKKISIDYCAKWISWLFITQMAIMYFFAGLSKFSPDWLSGKFIEIRFSRLSMHPHLGFLYGNKIFHMLITY